MGSFLAAHASGQTWRECVAQCAGRLGRPGGGLGFVYFTDALLPNAEAIVLWLRRNLPDRADEIVGRSRHYYNQFLQQVSPVVAG